MQITWHGNTCVKIVSKEAGVVINPPAEKSGVRPFKQKVDIAVLTRSAEDAKDLLDVSAVPGEPFLLDHPGEYEVKGVMMQGIDVAKKSEDVVELYESIYTFKVEGVRLCHLGYINRELTQDELDRIGLVDVLFLPVGGGEGYSAATASKVANSIEPRILIPINYAEGKSDVLDGIEPFYKEFGIEKKKVQDKLTIRKNQLPQEETLVSVISSQA